MKQQGFVSLFTCIMISLLLLVITVSLISLEALQLRKAEDAEQTLRAYYTAEAGVEDAVSKVLSKAIRPGVGDNVCNSFSTYDIPGAAGWTCQQVSFSGTPFGKLDTPDEAKTVDPGKTTPAYNSVILEWNQSPNVAAGQYNVNLAAGLPSQAAYTAAYAAAPVELAIVQYPDGGFAAGDPSVKLQNAVIVPGGAVGQGGATVNYGALANHGPWRGDCSPLPRVNPWGSSSYNCYAVITGLNPSSDYIFRIRSRYMASAFRMTFKTGANGAGTVVDVPDGTATIDVTAKAGQTYRRVISKLPLNGSAAAALNYVIYSDTDVCKNFDVIDNVAQPGCPY
jgi:hypothetical protein